MPKPADYAISSLHRMTQLISEMGFGGFSGERPQNFLAAGEAVVSGERHGVILEMDGATGQGRVLAIAPWDRMDVRNVIVDFEGKNAAVEEVEKEVDQIIENAGDDAPFS